ncbi:MAG: FAD-dependent oxidoreductase [Thermoanaerobaculia bacterium]
MNVGVVGGGVVGSVVALEAIRLGWSVTLFDAPDASLRCSNTAAGMLSPCAELETADSDLFNLGVRSLEQWPSLLRTLPEPVFFRREGSLLTAHAGDGTSLRRLLDLMDRKTGQRFAPVAPEALQVLEPQWSMRGEVYYLPNEGQIDSQGFLAAATRLFAHSGVLHRAVASRVGPHAVDLQDGTHHPFDWVFDCRGLGAKTDLADLRGVRGEMIWVHAPGVGLRRPLRLMHPRYRMYLVPRPDDVYLVGATEIESEDRSPLSVRSALELLSALFSIHSAFAEARIIRSDVNLRPAFPDNRPRVEQVDGLTRINGMFRHGFLIAPALVMDALAFVAEGRSISPEAIMENVENAYAAD